MFTNCMASTGLEKKASAPAFSTTRLICEPGPTQAEMTTIGVLPISGSCLDLDIPQAMFEDGDDEFRLVLIILDVQYLCLIYRDSISLGLRAPFMSRQVDDLRCPAYRLVAQLPLKEGLHLGQLVRG